MLYNVYYKEEYFPDIIEIDYIYNETTKEKYNTVEEFIEALVNDGDPINHVGYMNVFFPFLEKGLKNLDYRLKITKTEHYSNYTPKLKPQTYTADIISNVAADYKDIKKLRVGSPTGDHYLINFNAFTDYHLINTNYSEDEVEFQAYLNSINCRSTSPAGAMKEDIGLRTFFTTTLTRAELFWELKKTANNPAIIEAYAYGYQGPGWCYDVNSMYLAQLKRVEFLPELMRAHRVKEKTLVPPHHFGVKYIDYHDSEIALPGEYVGPGDWILPPSTKPNPFIKVIDRLWTEKQEFKKVGGCAYRFYKMKANSFVGCFAQKKRLSRHYATWESEDFRTDKDKGPSISRYDIFGIITALARRTLRDYMEMARARGCQVLQCNTDGFIVDRPIPDFVDSEELGGLRLDKAMTNLYIFSPNQYVADGVQCISGLPKGIYKPGTTKYQFEQVRYNPYENKFYINAVNVDLLKTIKELYFLTEEDIMNGGYY